MFPLSSIKSLVLCNSRPENKNVIIVSLTKKNKKLSLAIALRDVLKGLEIKDVVVVIVDPDIIETPLSSA